MRDSRFKQKACLKDVEDKCEGAQSWGQQGNALGGLDLVFYLTGESSPWTPVQTGCSQPSSNLQVTSLSWVPWRKEAKWWLATWNRAPWPLLPSPQAKGTPCLAKLESSNSATLNQASYFHLYHCRINNLESSSRKSWESKKSGNGRNDYSDQEKV